MAAMVLPGGAEPSPRQPGFALAAVLTYGTNILVAALGLLNVIVISRVLGPEGRGDVALLTTIGYLTAQLSTLGVEQANANLAASEPHSRRSLAGNAVAFAAVAGAIAAGAVLALVALFPAAGGDVSPELRWVALGAIPVLIAQPLLDYLVRADYGHLAANAGWLLQPLTTLTVNGVAALLGELSVGIAIGSWLAGQALTLLVLGGWVATRSVGFGRPSASLARRSLGFGVRAHAGRVMTLGNYRLDQWVVGGAAGSYELGLYSVAVSWAEALFYLPTALTLVQRPDLVRASREEAASLAARAFRAAVLITVPLAVLLVLAAPFLCVTVMRGDFAGSVDDLRVLALGGFGMIALKVLGNALTAQRRPLLATAGMASAFVLTIVLDVLLIPRYGGLGAAIASTVAYTGGGIVIFLIFVRTLRARPSELTPRPSDVPALVSQARRLVARARA